MEGGGEGGLTPSSGRIKPHRRRRVGRPADSAILIAELLVCCSNVCLRHKELKAVNDALGDDKEDIWSSGIEEGVAN
jgi:hypothetical protein